MVDSSVRAVATDPRWLPHTFDAGGELLTFAFVPRDQRDELMFLSDEHYRDRFAKVTHQAAAVVGQAPAEMPAPLHFIFHTSFCGSTLLVKALELPGRTLGLKEPDVLINLANRFARGDDLANRRRLGLALRLLARPFAPGEAVLVKPTNFANRLAAPVLELEAGARAVLLYSDLPTFLRSMVKKGIWGRIWARKLFRSVAAWSSLEHGYGAGDLFELTDLQVAGLAWLMQVHHFGLIAGGWPERTRLVRSEAFLADPAPTLAQVAAFFGLPVDAGELGAIANGPVFSRHSKLSQLDYSVEQREADHEAAIAAHREEIETVVQWVQAVAGHCRVAMDPAAA